MIVVEQEDGMKELKPCPFCGGEAFYTYLGENEWAVRCFDCEAEVKAWQGFSCDMKEGREKAIEKWNRRMSDD